MKNPFPMQSFAYLSMMLPIIITALLLGSVLYIGGIGFIQYQLASANPRYQAQLIEVHTQQYQRFFNQWSDVQQSSLQRIVQQPWVQQALMQPNAATLAQIQADLADYLPYAMIAYLIPTGEARLDSLAEPPLSFAALDMIRRAEQGQTVAFEFHQYQNQPYLQLVQAVRAPIDQSLLGTLSLSVEFAALTDAMQLLQHDKGLITLKQQFANTSAQTLLQLGSHTGNTRYDLPLKHPHLTLEYTPDNTLAQAQIIQLKGYELPLLALSILWPVLIFGLAALLAYRLRQDHRLLLRFIHHQFTGKPGPIPQFRLQPVYQLATRMAQIQPRLGGVDSPEPLLKPKSVSADHSAPAAVLGEAAILDLQLSDADSHRLEAGQPHTPQPSVLGEQISLTAEIFRAYDIRGIVGQTLDTAIAYSIGRAIGSEALHLGQQTLIVGRDGRLSSAELAQALINGLTDSGRDVIDIGLVPTPVVYYATHILGARSGVMVTGSHNPAAHNGFKIVLDGLVLAQAQILALLHRIQQGQFSEGQGTVTQQDIMHNYINRITSDIQINRRLKVVFDCGNGAAGSIAPQLFDTLNCEAIGLHTQVDGSFPHHHPDPSVADNLRDLIERVNQEQADLGIAFDGDGDRIGVVSNSGKIIPADRLLMLLAKDLLTRNPGAKVVFDVKCTRRLKGLIIGYGGKPIMCSSGHSLIKRQMKASGALLGGEMSGHIFFKERWYGFDDGLYAAARLLEILSQSPRSIDSLISVFPEDVSTPEILIPVLEPQKFAIVSRLKQQADFVDATVIDIDGLRVEFPDGWGLVRASNTSANLVLRFEGETEEALMRIRNLITEQLKAVDSSLVFPY